MLQPASYENWAIRSLSTDKMEALLPLLENSRTTNRVASIQKAFNKCLFSHKDHWKVRWRTRAFRVRITRLYLLQFSIFTLTWQQKSDLPDHASLMAESRLTVQGSSPLYTLTQDFKSQIYKQHNLDQYTFVQSNHI